MAKKHKETISQATQDEALSMAKRVQKPGQTKEQTKLIALGIQKGIIEYKKQTKAKQREADKAKKKKSTTSYVEQTINEQTTQSSNSFFAWGLLALSWIGFISYTFLNK